MIQRVQSIFLIIGCVFLAGNYLLGEIWIGPASVRSSWFTSVTLGLYSLALIGGLLSIFLYKSLERQKKSISVVMMTAVFGFIVLSIGLFLANSVPLVSGEEVSTQLWLAVVFPIMSIACFELARRGVNRDMKLLKSVDRLR